MLIFNILYLMLFNKCSRCHQGDVFISKNPYKLSMIFKMHKNAVIVNWSTKVNQAFLMAHYMFLMPYHQVGL